MNINLTGRYDGADISASALPIDIVAFERQYGMGLGKAGEQSRMEHIIWLLWKATLRTKQHSEANFEVWLEKLESVKDQQAEAPVVPLDPEVSTD